jgi:hypothetical protein
VGGEAPVTPVSSPDSSPLDLSYKPCDNRAKPQKSGSGQKRDMSKVKSFACKKMGHYDGPCPNKKKRSGGTAATGDEEFQVQFERECVFLICCTSVETTPSI